MELNIHPVVVHFPIALLTLYALFELARFKKLTNQTWYRPVKLAFLFLGTLFASLAAKTGEIAAGEGTNTIVEMHERMANMSIWIFSILAVAYLVALFFEHPNMQKYVQRMGSLGPLLRKLSGIITMISPLLALAGLFTITATGALGGAMVYGPDVDPIVRFIYDLLIN